MNILAIGDIVGRPGRKAVSELLPSIIADNSIDFVTVNVENTSGGKGITPKNAEELSTLPIDCMTGGNHIWEQKDIYPLFNKYKILRPANVAKDSPGSGWLFFTKKGKRIAVISLQGEVFMDNKGRKPTNPFHFMDEILPEMQNKADIILVDFHAEATSEKRAMGFFLDGKVSAVLGTHTHIQTADEEILPNGTAYISDLGMTGPHRSVIGLNVDDALKRFLEGEKGNFKVAKEGVRLEAVIIEIDDMDNSVKSISRIKKILR